MIKPLNRLDTYLEVSYLESEHTLSHLRILSSIFIGLSYIFSQ